MKIQTWVKDGELHTKPNKERPLELMADLLEIGKTIQASLRWETDILKYSWEKSMSIVLQNKSGD